MNTLSAFKSIRNFIFDIDGVLTNGQLLVHTDGTLLRSTNIKDGYALQLAIKQGYNIAIISGAKGDGIFDRFYNLGIRAIYLGIEDKLSKLNELNFSLEETLYMGDDMPDISPMQHVFLPCCPSDACEEVKQISKYISPLSGGKGCVRDVIEKVLKLNGHWK